MSESSPQQFLEQFIPELARKSKQLNQALWLLETTGASDAAELKAGLDAEVRILLSDPGMYRKLVEWQKTPAPPVVKRELDVLRRAFQQNQVEKSLLQEIASKEASLAQSYGSFRPMFRGQFASENDLRKVLKTEEDIAQRKNAWGACKAIGPVLAPQILALVALRNKMAKQLGFSDYFQMQLELQEVDRGWLLKTFEELGRASDKAYSALRREIDAALSARFRCRLEELGAWSWSDPFGQEDPLDSHELDQLLEGVDIAQASTLFYQRMGLDVAPILARSDMLERPGKNQHAFCIHIDREGDIRTLNNVEPSMKWLETVLHELGHAIYELGLDAKLPWLLREPPHMITTEAMALLAGRQAYREQSLRTLARGTESLLKKAALSLRRRQLIFSRWVLVMTAFESELYRDPTQDLNRLWWQLVETHQKIAAPKGRGASADWACKYHLGLAPVYYFSYLLGEMFASEIQEALPGGSLDTPEAGKFLQEKLFAPGNRMPWDQLVRHVTGRPLSAEAWLREFC